MHVIVGQGQLDAVLQARPEDRRGFIEEAAGVLKHRKRKEKALRKLDAMQANLTRLSDLTGELRRQLKPLGRQAEVARRAAGVQAELRDSRLRLLADDLLTLRTADRGRGRPTRRRCGPERSRGRGRARRPRADREADLDARQAAAAPQLAARPGHLVPAVRAGRAVPGHVAAGRRAGPEPARARWPPVAPGATRTSWTPRPSPSGPTRPAAATNSTQAAEPARRGRVRAARRPNAALAEAERALVAATRAVADRREGLARLTGQVNALRTRAEAGADEIARLRRPRPRPGHRAAAAEARLAQVEAEVGVLDEGEVGLDEQHEAAVAAL